MPSKASASTLIPAQNQPLRPDEAEVPDLIWTVAVSSRAVPSGLIPIRSSSCVPVGTLFGMETVPSTAPTVLLVSDPSVTVEECSCTETEVTGLNPVPDTARLPPRLVAFVLVSTMQSATGYTLPAVPGPQSALCAAAWPPTSAPPAAPRATAKTAAVRRAKSPRARRGGGGGSKRRLLIRCSSLMQGPQTATDRVTGGDRTENSPHSWPPNRETQSWNSKRVNQMCALTIQSKQPVTIPERRQVKRRPLPQDGCTE